MKNPSRPFVRTPFNYDADRASVISGLSCPEPTLAQQQFRDEVDINTITDRFGLTGELPVPRAMPTYTDYTETVTDFQSAMNLVRQAEESFLDLPARVRDRFSNNPQLLLEFVMNPENLEEARKLGLARPADPPVPSTLPSE